MTNIIALSPGYFGGIWAQKNFKSGTITVFVLLFLASVYGGYFGAGVSVIVLAILGLIYDDSLTSLNVLSRQFPFV